jgi:hypothetical protein
MGAILVKALSTQGTRSRLTRAQPRAGIVDQGRFTPRLRVSSSNGRTFDSPEAQLRQASRRSNLGQITTPTDRIAGAFNARVRQPPQSTRAPRPLLVRGSKAGPSEGFDNRLRTRRARDDSGYIRYMAEARATLPRYPRTFPRPAGAIL